MTIQYSPTWNSAGNNFSCILANVIDVASASGSTLLDLKINNTSIASINKLGLLNCSSVSLSNQITTPSLLLSGNYSSSAWTTNGVGISHTTRTLTDTSSSGTVASAYTNVLGGNTIAANSATTYTDYSTLFLGSPIAGSNVTITNGWSLITSGAIKSGGAITSSGQFTNALGTITSSTPATFSQTWNSGATTFTGVLVDITNTASSSSSYLINCQLNGSSRFNVTNSCLTAGQNILAGNGGALIKDGIFCSYTGATTYPAFGWATSGYVVESTTPAFGFYTEGAYIVGLRGSTNAHTFRIYNTYTSSTSSEYFQQSWVSNEIRLGTAVGSLGGTQRATVFGKWDSAGAFTHQMSVNPTSNCVQVGVQDTTYYRCRFMVTTDNTSTTIGNNSIADQGIYIGNSTNTINRPVGVQFGGQPGWAFGGVYGIMTNTGGNTYGDVAIATRLSASAGSLSAVARWYGSTGKVVFSGSFENQGMGNTTDTQFTVTVPNHVNQIATVESPDILFTLGSKTWATGAITTQRFFRITQPTANFAAASTITTASTLSIVGAPVAGTNATITNSYALNVESGTSNFGGATTHASTATFTGTGAGLGAQQLVSSPFSWCIYSGGTIQSPLFNVNGWYGMVDGAAGGLQFFSGHGIAWNGSAASGTITRFSLSGDTGLFRDGAGILGLRWSTTAQSFRIYNTYTSATNAEWLQQGWTSNECRLGTAVGSAGGTQRNLVLGAWDATPTWYPKMVIEPATTGAIYFESSTAGSARGTYAIDLQLYRSSSSQVASAYGVTIGTQCTVSSGNGSIAIGRNNSVTDSLGGSVAIGRNLTSNGYRSVVLGNNSTAHYDGVAIGTASLSTHASAVCFVGANSLWTGANSGAILWHASSNTEQMAGTAYNSGRIHGGGSEIGTICIRTTSNTLTTLQSISYAGHFNSTNRQGNKAMLYTASFTITAVRSDGACAKFGRKVLVKSVADPAGSTYTCTLLQSETVGTDVNEIAGASVTISASSSQTLDIQVTGEPNYACTGVSATNIITAVGHPFANNDIIVFTALTGGSSLSANPTGQYYLGKYKVINVSGNDFQLATIGSSTTPLALGSDISSGTVARAILWTKVDSTFAVVAGGY